MSFLKEITKKIFNAPLALVSTLVVAFIGGAVTNVVTSNSILEYKSAFQDKYFEIAGKAPEDLEIQHKGRKLEDISVYDIYIHNRLQWFKEPENVKIFFEISEKENKPIPQLIVKKLYSPSNLPQGIGIESEEQNVKNLYAFNIKVVKKTDQRDPYIARFIFEGKETPNIKITPPPLNANVHIIPYADWVDYLLPAIVSMVVYALFFLIILSLSSFLFERSWPKTKSRLVNDLSRTKNLKLDETEVNLIADVYKKEFKPKSVIQLIQGKKSNDDTKLNE
jgi:hypothetical protein